ncbi:T9SS type A sorting domain-containing protein [Algoriphagus sp. CAU 1675]|uniref:T9SS type A sorting domain-containing protein n=1 Tax=Algoriphagus sp. CAU 1675 TaxID=3032597 RepID=UPI0023DC7894|nr:T9SS type A sorting domain-containing protein [Algoriphagus sp. CAU 1675]MDF2156895.1 T9SS type A sorting domain-containing protein [Algoriphagus sp. CAU 1675]
MRRLLIILLITLSQNLLGQQIYRINQAPAMKVDGQPLPSPFAGGINSAQIQSIDLTQDGKEEWVIWDINSRQLMVFKKENGSFIHLPELSYLFPPDISGFMVLADYDLDGKKDLFTSTALGIKAYRNTSSSGQISWETAQNFLRLDGAANIQANNLDTPLIQDLDNDGDLDLVIFNFASGDYLEFYKNTSVERKGTPDIDGFAFPITHWGNFEFCSCGNISFGQTCSGLDLDSRITENENQRIQHSGGHSILYRDFDGDGTPDLLLGRDECDKLYFLPNQGTQSQATFNSFSNEIPQLGALPSFPIFHNPQFLDGKLVISLNTNEQALIYGIDFAQSIFQNEGFEDYQPILQNMQVDLGENARPLFQGNESAGELLVTSNITKVDGVFAEISRFSFPEGTFSLEERNYLNLRAQQLLDVQLLRFSDAQGKSYFLASGIRYEGNIPNQIILDLNGANTPIFELAGYKPSRGDYLQFFVYGGKNHLLVAGQNGRLDWYEVDFTQQTATLKEADFLGFVDNPATRNLSISVDSTSEPDLFAVDQRGILIRVKDFMNNPQTDEIQVQIGDLFLPTRLGRNTWITLVKPLLDGSPDLILGTRAGGLIYLDAAEFEEPSLGDFRLKVYPNPSHGPIRIISNLPATGSLFTSMGQVLISGLKINANQVLEVESGFLAPGLYILRLEVEGGITESRKVWIR